MQESIKVRSINVYGLIEGENNIYRKSPSYKHLDALEDELSKSRGETDMHIELIGVWVVGNYFVHGQIRQQITGLSTVDYTYAGKEVVGIIDATGPGGSQKTFELGVDNILRLRMVGNKLVA